MPSHISAEVYGFVSWIVSFLAFGLWFVWAFVPENMLHMYGMTYYPSKYWAITVPAYVCVLPVFIFLAYNALNFMNTPPMNSYNLIYDEYSKAPSKADVLGGDSIPSVSDIPIQQVNEKLYFEPQKTVYVSPHKMRKKSDHMQPPQSES
eukprot:Platyproteum_vivax@DN12337_c0_g1_i1.p1